MLVDSGKEVTFLKTMQLIHNTGFSWKNNWFTDVIFPKKAVPDNELNMQTYGYWNHIFYYFMLSSNEINTAEGMPSG